VVQQEIERDRGGGEVGGKFIYGGAVAQKSIRQSQGDRDPQRHRRRQPGRTSDRVHIVVMSDDVPLCPARQPNSDSTDPLTMVRFAVISGGNHLNSITNDDHSRLPACRLAWCREGLTRNVCQSVVISLMATRAAFFVDDRVIGGERGGQRVQCQVVDGAGMSAGGVPRRRAASVDAALPVGRRGGGGTAGRGAIGCRRWRRKAALLLPPGCQANYAAGQQCQIKIHR
jgi:hypothetical protein